MPARRIVLTAAKGTKSWDVKLASSLGKGTYTIYARLTDAAKHVAKAHRTVVVK